MILDQLISASRYSGLHPGFALAFDFISRNDLSKLPPGRHAIEGDLLYVGISDEQGRGQAAARLEAHRRYIDIQCAIAGNDELGWRPLANCSRMADEYVPERDIIFFQERPESWFTLRPGAFTILFPEDAHAPLAGTGAVRKAVFKVALAWHR
ncbi:MAG TPA: YhcH/YjgK/YiaL family protein [Pirellulales bacterium]|jgi:YhcH/YjgK/YiaL family protein|nr:YhcH/YjgK/YiaL family protein [Pirellulales bacterium]